MTTSLPRFGIWALVHGSRGAYQDPDEPYDASWERNRALVLAADEIGFDSVLIAQHTINPHIEDFDQLEAWSAASALAALTSKIEIIAAISVVNGWTRPEIDKAGLGFAEHDDRYAYGREWISIVSRLLSGERVTFKGAHFDVRDYMLRPKDL